MLNDEEHLALLRPPVSAWIEAFNAHDVEAIVALYADDAELYDAGMRYRRRGRAQIERWFRTRFRTMPSIHYTPAGQALQDDAQAAVTWVASGRTPPPLGLQRLSRPFNVDGVSIFTLRNGLIQQQRGYYDHSAIMEQVVPPLKWIFSRTRL